MRVLLLAILLLSTLAFAEEDCNIVGHVSNITVKQCNSNQDFIQITGNENSQVALENSPGVLIGINSVFVPNKSKDIWMIHRVVGAHTHVVNFFEISEFLMARSPLSCLLPLHGLTFVSLADMPVRIAADNVSLTFAALEQ